MRLLIDMDSVLVQLLPAWLARYNEDYQDNLTPAQITSWDLHPLVRPACGLRIYDYLLEPGFFRHLPPIEGGSATLEHLQEEKGHEIFLATAAPLRSPSAMWDKLEWVRQHLPFLPAASVLFVHPKWLLDAELLLDDNPTQLDNFPQISVAMDYPYNQKSGQHRVHSWEEFRLLVTRLATNDLPPKK